MIKILVLVHYYFKKNKAGGEKYLHFFIKLIQEVYKESLINVILPEKEKDEHYIYEDINIYELSKDNKNYLDKIKEYDLVISHLDYSYKVSNYCEKINKKYITIIHAGDTFYSNLIIRPNNIVIYNCYNTYKKFLDINVYNNNFFIINPYIPYLENNKHFLNIEDREYITLVNLNIHKGYDILIKLAEHFPNKKFLAVKGGYYDQKVKDIKKYSNIHIIKQTNNMLEDVYLKSKIIIMPSINESYGMVAGEAICLGIPVICTKLDGLKDNLGKVGLYCERENIEQWINKINILDDLDTYLLYSNHFLSRAEENYKTYNKQCSYFINNINEKLKL